MNIGVLNIRCKIEFPIISVDPVYGSPETTWTTLGSRWCNVQDVLPSRSEAVKQGLQVAKNQTRLRLRYCTDIDSSMRVIINRPDPITYNIIAGPAVLGDKDGVEFVIERVTT